jgi:tyrosine-protein kinase Etk/Wzc
MVDIDKNATVNLAQLQQSSAGDTITLLEALGILWRHKFFLVFCIVLGAVVGTGIGMWIRPQFTSDALLQVNVKGGNKATKAMGEMGALLDMSSPADAEIELIKSRMVLDFVVAEEHLAYSATPVDWLNRLLHREGRMDIDELSIPAIARGERWMAMATGPNTYAVYTPEESKLVEGKVGDRLVAPYAGDTLAIRVRLMRATEGEMFRLSQRNPLVAARGLAKSLNVAEKGKQTGIISVKYSHRYADRAASILNTIAKTYLRQNVEMRSAEAQKTLEFLEGQLPGVKAKLDSAEKILADYRHKIGSVDMTGETKAHLDKEVTLQREILALEQDRQAAMRLFKEEHPNVRTIVKQQDKLRSELARLKKNAETMPLTQQEIMRLQEEVAVNNEVYTNMLNNIQQLRVVRAGEVGNVRIVDYAQIEQIQSKPKKFNILICAIAASFMIGVLLVFLRRMLRNGVRSSLEVERATDMSVFAKIPQFSSSLRKGKWHLHRGIPFVVSHPDDPVSEAFRSLQTALEFSLSKVDHKVLMVTGLIPGVGKSFVSLNLAALLAESGKKVLLVDADMRLGVFRGKGEFGLAEILCGMATIETAMVKGNVDNLFVIGGGKIHTSACELLRGEPMAKFVEEARSKFDFVIIDTPPLTLVTDAELVYPLADFGLYVLHYGKHTIDQIKETMEKLHRYAQKPGAFVMNHCEHDSGHYGYGYGYYRYGYGKRR